MIKIENIILTNGKDIRLKPDNRRINTREELEIYRHELSEKHQCEVEFVYKDIEK